MRRPSASVVTALSGLAAVALIVGVAATRPTAVPVPTFPTVTVTPVPTTDPMIDPPTGYYLPPSVTDIPTQSPGETPDPMS